MAKKPTYEELENRIHELEQAESGRKWAEKALRESEDKYRTYIEHANDGIAVVHKGKLTFVNSRLAEIIGFKVDELEGKDFLQFIPKGKLNQITDNLKRRLSGEEVPQVYESRILHKDSSEIDVEFNTTTIESNDEPATLTIIRDITERKQAEEALRESEARFRLLTEMSPVGVYQTDAKGDCVYVNKKWCDMAGVSPEEATGTGWVKRLYPEDRERIEASWYKMTESKGKWGLEYRFRPSDDSTIWVYGVAAPLLDEKGAIVGYMGINTDISERKLAEEVLLESEEKLRMALECAVADSWDMNMSTEEMFYGDQWARHLGYEPGEVPYTIEGTMQLLHPDDIPNNQKALEAHLSGRKPIYETETRIRRKDGTYASIISRGKIVERDEKGNPVRLTGTNMDITERKRAEEKREALESQLRQSQKMEAVGTLAGGIAHDFNNILAIILGNAELASDDVPDWNPASHSLKEIRKASIRAKDMVQQLLAFSRKTDEENKPLNMTPIIKESMKMLRFAIPTSVAFTERISDDPCNILGDATQINQIMMNLVTNAADAMFEEGGLLEVTLEKTFLQEEKICFDWVLSPGAYVTLKVRDTGEGIDPGVMDRIFDPYYTTKEVGKGTGMGLSVIHGIVNSHGGGVRVESKLGEGTLFEIYFPALEKISEEEKKPEGQIKGGSEKILFVDDEESVVKLNHQLLERLGYQVQSTTKPLEALEWFKADPDQFDVIITDMTMPRLTGDRLAAEVLKIRPQMSVIICTGYSERMSTEKAEALGARKYLEKPIDLLNLASSLREVIEGK